jgi:hypothetical protein
MRPPSHEIRKFQIVLPADEVERLRPLLREDEGITCLIKRILRETAQSSTSPTDPYPASS